MTSPQFISAQTGIRLLSIENILITECTFQDSSNTAIFAESVNNWSSITIEYCLFINNNGYGGGGGVWLHLSTGDISISHCTFQNDSATYGGGGCGGGGSGMLLNLSTGISNSTFQNTGASYYGGVELSSTGDVIISFQNTVYLQTKML